MKIFLQITFTLILILIIPFSCTLDQGPFYINPCPCDTTPFKDCDCDPDTITNVRYSTDVQAVWDKYCIDCHDGNIEPINLKANSSYTFIMEYVDVSLPEASNIYQLMFMNVMPPEEDYRPTNDELDLVLAWIMQGAKDN